VLLADELLLLALDDEKGTLSGFAQSYEGALAGALLLDLVLAERLHERDGDLVPTGVGALEPPLLGEALQVVRASERPRDAGHWIGALPKALKPLHARLADGLAGAGVLDAQRGKVLGLFDRARWPERDPEPERALRARLRAVLVDGAEPDQRTALLLGLLRPLHMVRGLVPKEARKAAEARAEEVARPGSVGGAVGDALEAAQTAVLVASIAATTAATASTSASSG
jgi:Golgi phosphoprotein 3 GPP34